MNHLNDFIDYLKSNFYAKSTISNYKSILNKAEIYFKEKNLEDEKLINEDHIIEFMKYLKENNTRDWVYYKVIESLKVYFRFLENSKIVFLNPTANITTPIQIRGKSKALPKDHIISILKKINTDNDHGIRGRAILELLYSTGMRPFELTNIKINQINFKEKIIFIEQGKNNKDRVVPVGETAIYWIEKYLREVRPKYLKDKSNQYLFITIKGTSKQLTRRGLYDAIKYTFLKNNIKRFKPYTFRTSCASHCLINGMDIMHIKELLGHNSIRTTQVYLHVETLNLQDVLNIKHPRNKY